MQTALSRFSRGVVTITSLPSWRGQQALVLLSESAMSFLALFMLKEGLGQESILGIFCAIFVASGMIIRSQRRRLVPDPKLIPLILSSVATIAALCAALSIAPAITLAIAALCVMSIKDMSTTTAVGDIHRAAEDSGQSPVNLVSTGMLLGALLMIVLLALGGRLLDLAPWGWTAFLLAANVGALVAILRGVIRLKAPAAVLPVPLSVQAICGLAVLYNATHFVGRRFVLPIAIAQLAIELGLGDQAYSALGGILSLLVLLGLATRSFSGGSTNSFTLMLAGYLSGLALWIMLSVILNFTAGLVSAALAVLCLFLIEITSKVWTLGFIETLRLKARCEGNPSPSSEVELTYFGYFMEVKSYGAAIGFAAALASLLIGVPTLIPMAATGLLAGFIMLAKRRSAFSSAS
jgi:hypothetical protein